MPPVGGLVGVAPLAGVTDSQLQSAGTTVAVQFTGALRVVLIRNVFGAGGGAPGKTIKLKAAGEITRALASWPEVLAWLVTSSVTGTGTLELPLATVTVPVYCPTASPAPITETWIRPFPVPAVLAI